PIEGSMHDISLIREAPEEFDAGLARRGLEPMAARLLALDESRRALIARREDLLARRDELSRPIRASQLEGGDADAPMAEVAEIKSALPALEEEQGEADRALDVLLAEIPNLPAGDVPDGEDESANVEFRRFGTPREIADPKDHVALGEG